MGNGSERLFIGTDHGLRSSSDEGNTWQAGMSGLPEGNIEQLAGALDLLLATLGDGGIYVSEDQGANWRRIDRDTERSFFTGLAVVGSGLAVAGSQSEGILRVALKPRP